MALWQGEVVVDLCGEGAEAITIHREASLIIDFCAINEIVLKALRGFTRFPAYFN